MADISDCVGNKHRGTREVAEKCLELILEHDRNEEGEIGELGAQVRRRRFLAHNKEWMEEVGSTGEKQDRVYRHGDGAYDSDDDLNIGGGRQYDYGASESESEIGGGSEGEDGEGEGGEHMFRSARGQKINVDTSGLSSGVEDSGEGSRGEYEGWGQ